MEFRWKKCLLVLYKILGLFFNMVTTDDKYFILNRDIFLQHLQMDLSLSEKNIFPISCCFFEM